MAKSELIASSYGQRGAKGDRQAAETPAQRLNRMEHSMSELRERLARTNPKSPKYAWLQRLLAERLVGLDIQRRIVSLSK